MGATRRQEAKRKYRGHALQKLRARGWERKVDREQKSPAQGRQ